jgi:hypothetical protein
MRVGAACSQALLNPYLGIRALHLLRKGVPVKIAPSQPAAAKRVFGTAKGISQNDCNVIISQIHRLFAQKSPALGVRLARARVKRISSIFNER